MNGISKPRWNGWLAVALLSSAFCIGPSATVSAASSAPVKAQMIKYGDTAQSRLTATTRQANFKFAGQQGDVFVMEAAAPEEYWTPTITVFRSNGTRWLHSDEDSSLGSVLSALPATDTYTIVVKSPYNMYSGAVQVNLRQVPLLETGVEVGDLLTPESNSTPRYVIKGGRPQTLHFERVSGDADLAIGVVAVTPDTGERKVVASLGGGYLHKGSLSFDSGNDAVLILELGSVQEGRIRYRLRLTTDETE